VQLVINIQQTFITIAIVIGCFIKDLLIVLSLKSLNTKRISIPNMKGSEGKLTPKLNSWFRRLTDKGVANTINQRSLSKEVK
jgi:hypothetical protein